MKKTNMSELSNMTRRRQAEMQSSLNREITPSTYEILRTELVDIIKKEVAEVVKEVLDVHFSNINKQLLHLEESIKFMNAEYEHMKGTFDVQGEEIQRLRSDNLSLKNVVSVLESKVLALDQEARQSNIEIHCMPEFKNENVVNIVKQICKVVSFPIEERDILTCTRTQKLNSQSKKPRAIVCKLPNKLKRDNLLASVLKYNRTHQKEKLHAGLIGVADDTSPIFITEHLSPSNKQLHAATRLRAREANYKFVWIRNGKVLVRKDEQSPVKIISHLDSLKALT